VTVTTLNTENDCIWILHVLHANLLDTIASVHCHSSRYSLQCDIIDQHISVPLNVLTRNMNVYRRYHKCGQYAQCTHNVLAIASLLENIDNTTN